MSDQAAALNIVPLKPNIELSHPAMMFSSSEISIEMFKNNQCMRKVERPVIRYGKRQKLIVQLSAWDIPDIAFLSVKAGNDYRYAA